MSARPTDALQPCPFCGSDDVDREFSRDGNGHTEPGCMNCGATAPIAWWNKALRVAPPTPPADAVQAIDKMAEEWRYRADDAGRLSRAWLALRAAPPSSEPSVAEGIEYVLTLSSNLLPSERSKLKSAAEIIRRRAPAATLRDALPPASGAQEKVTTVWGPEKQDYPGGPIYRVGTSNGVNAPQSETAASAMAKVPDGMVPVATWEESNRCYLEQFDRAERLQHELASKQAHLDRVMLEHCQDEMTAEQIENWKRHQVAAAPSPTGNKEKSNG